MSGKSGSVGSIVLGVALIVIGAVGSFTGAWALIPSGVLLVAGGAIGLAFAPKSQDQQQAAAQEFKITTAATGIPTPVVFGQARVTCNYMRASGQSFLVEDVETDAGGKGGGGTSYTAGQNYYLRWEQRICMGEIDAVGQVYSMPGEVKMLTAYYGEPVDELTYVDLETPVTLSAGVQYVLVSEEENGGDEWYDAAATVLTTTSDATVNGLAHSKSGGPYSADYGTGHCGVPVGFKYTVGGGPETEFVTGITFGDVRSNYTGWQGMCFTVGASDIEVTALGRIYKDGNTNHHNLRIVSLDGDTIYATADWDPATQFVDDEPWVEFGSEDYIDLDLEPVPNSALAEGFQLEGGTVRVYKGSATQTRGGAEDYYGGDGVAYRRVAWALFGVGGTKGFCVGQVSPPRSYQFCVRRLPRCVRDDGSTVTGLKTRGSDDTENQAYYLANPAAIYYEAITNKVWGRGLSSDIIDEDSFVNASEYFASKNLGLGLVLEQPTTLNEFLDGIAGHVKTLLTWDGEVYKLKALTDIQSTHGTIVTLRASDLVNFRVRVPSWETGTTNELRAEFTSSERSDRPDVATAQDLACISILGGRINSKRIQLPGFYSADVAFSQAARILSELSYPYKTAEWEMNRFQSHIAVGEVVRVIWDDWTENVITSYWQVAKIQDGSSDEENIKVWGVEDQILSPVEGEELEVELPDDNPWEHVTPPVPPVEPPPELAPSTAFVFEPTVFSALNFGRPHGSLVVTAMEKVSPEHIWDSVRWSYNDAEYHNVTSTAPTSRNVGTLCISGVLVDAMPGFQGFDRSPAGILFDVDDGLSKAADLMAVLEVVDELDGLEAALNQRANYLVCEEEVMKVGYIERVSSDRFRLRNVIRGVEGTVPMNHAVGADIFYLSALTPGVGLVDSSLSSVNGTNIYFGVQPLIGGPPDQTVVQPFHYGAFDGMLYSVSLRPPPPELVSVERDGDVATVVVRHRFGDSGAEVDSWESVAASPLGAYNFQDYTVQQIDAGGNELFGAPVAVDSVYHHGSLSTPHYVELTVDLEPDAVALRVHEKEGWYNSYNYAEAALPAAGS